MLEYLSDVPIIHSMLKDDFSIDLTPADMSATSLVYVLNHLGIKTFWSCGGHYKEHKMVFGGYDNSEESFPFKFPWITLQSSEDNNGLIEGIEEVLRESLWEMEYKKDRDRICIKPDKEFFPNVALKREYVQQTQREMVSLASQIMQEYGKDSAKKREVIQAINEHQWILSKEINFINNHSREIIDLHSLMIQSILGFQSTTYSAKELERIVYLRT